MSMFKCRSPRWAVALAFGVVVPCLSFDARASQEEARRYFKNGVELITGSQPNYQDAYYQFQLAYRESAQSWKVLGNLGLCALKLERDQEAVEYYERYLEKGGSDIAVEERTAIEQDLLLLKGNLATLRITSPVKDLKIIDQRAGSTVPAQAYVLQGGVLELSLRAGNHSISASLGDKRLTWDVVLEPKAVAQHVFDFDADTKATGSGPAAAGATTPAAAPTASSGMRVGGYVALGVGALGLGLGGFFMWQSVDYSRQSDEAFGCDRLMRGCNVGEQQEVRRLEDQSGSARTRGFVALGVGGAAVATGAALLLLSGGRATTERERASITPWVGYRAVGVLGSF
jgi:hypothetical protein